MMKSKPKRSENVFGALPSSLTGTQVGVWHLVGERTSGKNWGYKLPPLSSLKALVWDTNILRLLGDVYSMAPVLFVLYATSFLLLGVNSALQLRFLNRLFDSIEHAIKTGQVDTSDMTSALMLRLGSVIFEAVTRWTQGRIGLILETRIRSFCRDMLMQRHLSTDLLAPSNADNALGDHFPGLISSCLRTPFEALETAFSTLAQLVVVVQLLGTQDDSWTLAALCLVRPLLSAFDKSVLWGQSLVYYVNNIAYRRLLTMYDIATKSNHKQEVISGGLKSWVLKEYRSAQGQLKNNIDKSPGSIYVRSSSTPAYATVLALSEDLPLAFYVVTGLVSGRPVSLTFLATLQQMTTSLRNAIESLSWTKTSISECSVFLEGLYAEPKESTSERKGGSLPYPSTEKQDGGMVIEFRNIDLKYPGSKDGTLAVNAVSFSLPASSLVVIVGENGSGKSSIVKLLTQLYAPSAGSIIIDGVDSNLYDKEALYASIALLTQDHTIFPLSIAENIAIGDPDDVDDMTKVVEAARLAGASAFIEKRANRYDEVLHPVRTWQTCRYQLPDGPLKKFSEDIERSTEVSGGEKQRLAASRTFRRLMSDKVKLVVVDEPTSAMDPTGEYELFETLRSMRAGKTMVFVTHRFGHLTKHADLILCMKDGILVESGTHRTLMELNGVYSELYDVQARAFADDVKID